MKKLTIALLISTLVPFVAYSSQTLTCSEKEQQIQQRLDAATKHQNKHEIERLTQKMKNVQLNCTKEKTVVKSEKKLEKAQQKVKKETNELKKAKVKGEKGKIEKKEKKLQHAKKELNEVKSDAAQLHEKLKSESDKK